MNKRTALAKGLMVLGILDLVPLAGCGSGSPASAPSTVKAPSPVPSPAPVQLSGVATDDDGAPVSGVAVFVTPFLNPPTGNTVTTVTDASGKYSITFNSLTTPAGLSVPVQTEKSGYESSVYDDVLGCVLRDASTNACRPDALTFVQNLRIYRIRTVPVGQSITIDVKRGDPECGDVGDEPCFCRTVRMTGPPGAMVAVQASTNPSNPVARLVLDPMSLTCCSLSVTANVPANGELAVSLGVLWYGPATAFTLTSAILP
jgi:hypothetical protein